MKFTGLLIVAALAVGFASEGRAQEGTSGKITISQMVICQTLNRETREPGEAGTVFADTVKQLYCFTHVEGAENETEITHKWFWGDQLLAEVPLPVKGSSWRTWSSKNIWQGWTGAWRVDVTDAAGEVLASKSFTIEKSR